MPIDFLLKILIFYIRIFFMSKTRGITKKIERDNINLSVASINKNDSTIIFFECNGYLTPSYEDEDGYSNSINLINKNFKNAISNYLKDNVFFDSRHMFDFTIPESLISFGKNSKFNTILLLKQKGADILQFKDITKKSLNGIGNLYDEFERIVEKNNFKIKKKK